MRVALQAAAVALLVGCLTAVAQYHGRDGPCGTLSYLGGSTTGANLSAACRAKNCSLAPVLSAAQVSCLQTKLMGPFQLSWAYDADDVCYLIQGSSGGAQSPIVAKNCSLK